MAERMAGQTPGSQLALDWSPSRLLTPKRGQGQQTVRRSTSGERTPRQESVFAENGHGVDEKKEHV